MWSLDSKVKTLASFSLTGSFLVWLPRSEEVDKPLILFRQVILRSG